MPTGYTSKIADGQSFADFVLGCARAFGPYLSLRDAPNGAPLPDEVMPDDYHLRALAKVEDELASINAMSDAECVLAAQDEYRLALESAARIQLEQKDLNRKYKVMLAAVIKWHPPSDEHIKLKDFMIEQIHTSATELFTVTTPTLDTEWRDTRIAVLLRDQKYYRTEYDEEVARCTANSKWIRLLKESL